MSSLLSGQTLLTAVEVTTSSVSTLTVSCLPRSWSNSPNGGGGDDPVSLNGDGLISSLADFFGDDSFAVDDRCGR